MKTEELRALSPEDINGKILTWEDELFRARCSKAVGQLGDTNVLPAKRRDIARAKTILNEKKTNAASE